MCIVTSSLPKKCACGAGRCCAHQVEKILVPTDGGLTRNVREQLACRTAVVNLLHIMAGGGAEA